MNTVAVHPSERSLLAAQFVYVFAQACERFSGYGVCSAVARHLALLDKAVQVARALYRTCCA